VVFDCTAEMVSTTTEPGTNQARISLYDLTYSTLEQFLVRDGLRPFHARALWRALYRGSDVFDQPATAFAPPLQRWIDHQLGASGACTLDVPAEDTVTRSSDGLTRKYLLRLADGQAIETVLMGYTGRHTACVSTQAGCAMGCVFCATGQMGFTRHLRAGEIVAQVRHARLDVEGGGLRNLVLMGMGEPLHNYDSVMTALEIISDTRGFNIGPRRITISTVGLVPAIRRMADEGQPYHLAVSLHGANDADRAALVPAGRRWPLSELMEACHHYVDRTDRKIFFEWTLIDGKNDSPEHAAELGELLNGLRSHVNLIPLNPTHGYAGQPTGNSAVTAFQKILAASGIPSTVRQRRGIDVAAGCGQLKVERSRRDDVPVEL
jgi:23S rRNA (adenine2503-C2)-methyltransferase